ncbi:MAG: CPBP family intramembrane metalloprotease [Sphingobacteriales bacterium]|nr:MAG: CPBP family intramembrane metalloprotease [Sphingobacteriales bacterium]
MATHPLFRVRYWRTYPWPMQLLLLLLLVFTLASLFTAIAYVVVQATTGASLPELSRVSRDSPRVFINGALLAQAFGTLGMFLVPALLFAYVSHPRPANYLGLRKPGRPIQWLLALMCILSSAPVFLAIDALLRQILPLKDSVTQATNDRLVGAFLETHTTPQLLGALIVVALLPAIAEELFFRGILFRFVAKKFPGAWPAVIGSAVCFAVIHSNPSGMLPIFLAGMLFAAFYYLTGSIWPGILAHFVYNGSQLLLYQVSQNQPALKAALAGNTVPMVYVIAGLLLFGLSFRLLWRLRTPLPEGWASDTDPLLDSSVPEA